MTDYVKDTKAFDVWLLSLLVTPYYNLKRWLRLVWFARTNAKLLHDTAQENGVLWGKIAKLSDDLRFTRLELDEVSEYNKFDALQLAPQYEAVASESAEYHHLTVDLMAYRQHYDFVTLGFDGAPDFLARKLAEETGRSWMENIYPKIATAMGVKKHKRNPKRLDFQSDERRRRDLVLCNRGV